MEILIPMLAGAAVFFGLAVYLDLRDRAEHRAVIARMTARRSL